MQNSTEAVMIRKKGQIIRLDTPHTTLVIKADSAEYLYYGKKLASTVGFEYLAGTPCKIFSQYGFDDYTEPSVLLYTVPAHQSVS